MPEVIEDLDLETLEFSKPTEEPKINTSRYYVDDEDLTRILTLWKIEYDAAKKAGSPAPRLPEAVGAAILDMAAQMGRRHNFSGYSYLEEMQSDAEIHCVKYIHNFNPNANTKKFKKQKISAFAYINMIIWRSFTARIKLEKREQYLKYKSFELLGGMDAFKDEDMSAASGGDEGDGGMSVGVLGADFINKAREYEQENDLGRKVKKEKVIAFDGFMFAMSAFTDEDPNTPDDIDLSLGDDIELETEVD